MLRAIILVLVLFMSIGAIIPLATNYAEAGAKKTEWRKEKKKKRFKRYITSRYTKVNKRSLRYRKSTSAKSTKRYRKTPAKRYRKASSSKRYRKRRTTKRYRNSRKRYAKAKKTVHTRKYSKKWLSNYRTEKSHQTAVARRKQNLRLKRIRLVEAKQITVSRTSASPTLPAAATKKVISISGNPILPGWMKEKLNEQVQANAPRNIQGNIQGNIPENAPRNVQQTNPDLVVVTNAVSPQSGRKNVAGVAISDLRKTVIDKMIQEKGWIVNDMEKFVDGKKVYVVVTKSPGVSGAVKSQIFYFTESKGQIYSLATVAPDDSNTQIVNQSEKLVKTLEGSGKTVQSAKNIDK